MALNITGTEEVKNLKVGQQFVTMELGPLTYTVKDQYPSGAFVVENTEGRTTIIPDNATVYPRSEVFLTSK